MMDFTVDPIIENALREDIGTGDITTDTLIPADARGSGYVMAKEDLVPAGLAVTARVFHLLDPQAVFTALCRQPCIRSRG